MNQNLAEILLFAFVAINAAVLMFIAGVLRRVMNDLDGPAFKHFLGSLYRHSTHSAFMITIFTIPLVGAIPYFYLYGFKNWWITVGLAIWLISGSIGKMIKLPVFKAVSALDGDDTDRMNTERQKLNSGNMLQAALNFVAAALMGGAFVHL